MTIHGKVRSRVAEISGSPNSSLLYWLLARRDHSGGQHQKRTNCAIKAMHGGCNGVHSREWRAILLGNDDPSFYPNHAQRPIENGLH
jgi:hypothetical protein